MSEAQSVSHSAVRVTQLSVASDLLFNSASFSLGIISEELTECLLRTVCARLRVDSCVHPLLETDKKARR